MSLNFDGLLTLEYTNPTEFTKQYKSLMEYPDGTMKNKLNIKDHDKLHDAEYKIVAKKSLDLLTNQGKQIQIKSVNQLITIHKYLFKDIYDWAGQFRNWDFNKNGHDFFDRASFSNGISYIDSLLNQANAKTTIDKQDFAELLDTTNQFHPFPEGNGRSTKVFLQLLAKQHGQQLNYERHQDNLITALNDSNIPEIANHLDVTNIDHPSRIHSKAKESDHNPNFTL